MNINQRSGLADATAHVFDEMIDRSTLQSAFEGGGATMPLENPFDHGIDRVGDERGVLLVVRCTSDDAFAVRSVTNFAISTSDTL